MTPNDHLGAPPDWQIREVVETASTNTDLLNLAETAQHRTVLRADHQTSGRGRLDRTWQAPPGANLLMSVLFRPAGDNPIAFMRQLAVAAVAAVRSVDTSLGAEVGLKWPNDIMVGQRKLAGLLAQQTGDVVVVGLGLNVGWAPDGGADLGGAVTPSQMMHRILANYDVLDGHANLLDLYRSELLTLGKQVRVELPGLDLHGEAVGVDDSGAIQVKSADGEMHTFHMGDVVHLRTASPSDTD